MSKLLTGLLIAAAAMAGIYAAAATTATAIAANFTPTPAAGQVRIVAFASAVKRASAEHRAARTKCELFIGAEKNFCNAEAKADEKRAKTAARVNYKGSINLPTDAGMNESKTARDIDVALYRAHQQ